MAADSHAPVIRIDEEMDQRPVSLPDGPANQLLVVKSYDYGFVFEISDVLSTWAEEVPGGEEPVNELDDGFEIGENGQAIAMAVEYVSVDGWEDRVSFQGSFLPFFLDAVFRSGVEDRVFFDKPPALASRFC